MTYEAVLYSETIVQSALRRGESGMAYDSLYIPSLAYDTLATSTTLTECTNLQKTVITKILPKMGINRKAPNTVVFGASSYGGFELDHLAAVQGFGWLQYLMGHLRGQDGTGKLVQMLIELTQLECGSLEPIFTLEYE
jgi:hypothetical protein